MDTGEPKPKGIKERLFNKIVSGLEPDEITTTQIYQYPTSGKAEVFVESITKKRPFRALQYRDGPVTEPNSIRTIPESPTRNFIHFLPPEAEEAFHRQQSEDDPWYEDPEFRVQGPKIMLRNVRAFTHFLNALRNGLLPEDAYITGETYRHMAGFAIEAGFHRCYEASDGGVPDFTPPMESEREYKVGVSVAELAEKYSFATGAPTEASVLATIRASRPKKATQPA